MSHGSLRRAKRKDVVHQPIVDGLEKHGIVVYDMPDPGDILCYGWHHTRLRSIWLPLELKSGNDIRKKKADGSEEFTPRQQRMRAKREKAPIPVVHTLAEALALFGMVVPE